jgi:hypothetical protein
MMFKLIRIARTIVTSIASPIVDLRLGFPLTGSFASSGIQPEKISMKYAVIRVNSSLIIS